MIKAVKIYLRYMDAISRIIGHFAKFLIFGMIGILLYETLTRTFFNHPNVWSVETAQFVMAAYYTLGGAFTLLIGGHVRMDLLYDRWSMKQKAVADAITFFIVLLYLGVLIYGGIQGIQYAAKYNQTSFSSWAPPVLPIKIIMVIGMVLMLLQCGAEFIKDLLVIRGEERINYDN
jgi:TRAP-type mannitol/chloroaromatic compound transport system permease small subunit